jgi:predicted Zn-dependent protease
MTVLLGSFAFVTAVAPSAEAYHLFECNWGSTGVRYENSASGRDYRAIFEQSVTDWNRVGMGLNYVSDGDIVLQIRNSGNNGYVGYTYGRTCRNAGGISLLSATIVYVSVNNSYAHDYPSSGVRWITGHELGHAIGLNHQSTTNSCAYYPIMYPDYSAYSVCGVKSPRTDDIAGFRAMYG